MKIFPSLASADQMNLKKEIYRIRDHKYLHFDIEDGNFVPNISFGMKTIQAAAKLSNAALDAHLMVTNPMDYLEKLKKLNFQAAAFHWESTGYPLRVLNKIKDLGMRAGIGLNPATDVRVLKPYLKEADYILIMTSEPDGRGDNFQETMLQKVKWIRENQEKSIEIIADGGIGSFELERLKKVGASGAVIGRKVFQAEDPMKALSELSG